MAIQLMTSIVRQTNPISHSSSATRDTRPRETGTVTGATLPCHSMFGSESVAAVIEGFGEDIVVTAAGLMVALYQQAVRRPSFYARKSGNSNRPIRAGGLQTPWRNSHSFATHRNS